MGFYETLSQYYDQIFPVNPVEVGFIKQRLDESKGKVLDIGCGTGGISLALAEAGYEVQGIDLDAEMVKKAVKKYKQEFQMKQKGHAKFDVVNMKDIRDKYMGTPFDSIVCLGNTLVHLQDQEEMRDVLQGIFSILKEQGTFILQIINYDRILDQSIQELPLIEIDKIRFERRYAYDEKEHKVYFRTSLEVLDSEMPRVFENQVSLYPLREKELAILLEDIGFQNIKWYGSFQGEAYTASSYATIITAEKHFST